MKNLIIPLIFIIGCKGLTVVDDSKSTGAQMINEALEEQGALTDERLNVIAHRCICHRPDEFECDCLRESGVHHDVVDKIDRCPHPHQDVKLVDKLLECGIFN